MFKFWVLKQTGKFSNTVRSLMAKSPEEAIKSEFGVKVKPASPFSFDFCTQESNENGYRYWLLDSAERSDLKERSES